MISLSWSNRVCRSECTLCGHLHGTSNTERWHCLEIVLGGELTPAAESTRRALLLSGECLTVSQFWWTEIEGCACSGKLPVTASWDTAETAPGLMAALLTHNHSRRMLIDCNGHGPPSPRKTDIGNRPAPLVLTTP